MNYIEETNEQAYREFEKILNDFRNGATYSDSIEKCQAFLLSAMNGQLESIKKNLPEMADDFEFTSDDDLESNPTKALNFGFNNALAQVQELLDQMKFNPEGR